jgi:hypothetical protein
MPLWAFPIIFTISLGLAHLWIRAVQYLGQLHAIMNAGV